MIAFFIIFAILFFSHDDICASAWPRDYRQIYANFEALYVSDRPNYRNSDSFYQTMSYKFYLEYGLSDKLTVGGYLKRYDYGSYFKNEYTVINKNTKNNLFSNGFLIYNLFNLDENLLSLRYSYYFPIKYDDYVEKINRLEIENVSEFSLLFGKNGSFDYLKYFVNGEFSYRYVPLHYDQLAFELTLGLRLNTSSTFAVQYKIQYDFEDGNIFNRTRLYALDYSDNTYNQFKVMLITNFLDNLSVELSLYQILFRGLNSTGLGISFIFVNF